MPAVGSAPPLLRENRLYQSDWLMRFYGFEVNEIVNEKHPNLDLDVDPKLSWALRHPEQFPIDLNRADYLSNVYTSSFTKEVSTKTFRRFYNTGQGCTYPPEQLPAL